MKTKKTAILVCVLALVLGCLLCGTAAAGNVSGEEIVNYARQYVGVTRYVYGGNSLTSGADCSGFICAVYEHFGINLWGKRTYLKYYGQEPYGISLDVSAIKNNNDFSAFLPGDIFIFPGHVAIYAGDGKIIHCTPKWFVQDRGKNDLYWYGAMEVPMNVFAKGSAVWTTYHAYAGQEYRKLISGAIRLNQVSSATMSPPSWVSVSMERDHVKVGDIATITYASDNATEFVFKYQNIMTGRTGQFKLTGRGQNRIRFNIEGTYLVTVTASNEYGSRDSETLWLVIEAGYGPQSDPVDEESTMETLPTSEREEERYESAEDGLIYLLDQQNRTATVIGVQDDEVESVTIPAKITVLEYRYQVTSIADKAFARLKKLTKVTIGKNVKTIGKKAFHNCSNLKTIRIKTTQLRSYRVGENAFLGINSKAVITVPEGKKKAYREILLAKGAEETITVTKK